MVTGALRNGARKMTRNTSRSKVSYIIPLVTVLRRFEHAISLLEPEADVSISEKKVFACLIADALDIDDPKLEQTYMRFIQDYESFGIDRNDIGLIFREYVYSLEALFKRYGVRKGPRYYFTWLPNGRNVFIYEED